MKKVNTLVIPIIRTDLIERCLETLYKHTPHNFYVYVIDQSYDGIDKRIIDKYIHQYIRPHRNLGFAKATNLGVKLVETEYVTFCNDDIEFINRDWWEGVLDTFDKVDKATPDRPCMLVNPSSIKLPDWSIGAPEGQHHEVIPYKKEYTQAEYDSLVNEKHFINERLTLNPGSVIDGITLYCSVIKTDLLKNVGLLDERYYPGSAEDYDLSCRAYLRGYRCVGTTLSWVYHHWSKTFESVRDEAKVRSLVDNSRRFGDYRNIWGDNLDVWGTKCSQCEEHLRTEDNKIAVCPKHPDEVFEIPPIGKTTL